MKHVLIVDADKSMRSHIAAAFERRDYSATGVASAQAGIAACEELLPDVIILELQLRSHSGVEFIHELRSYPEWQDIPIVLYTLVPWSQLEKFEGSFKDIGIARYAYKPETSLQKLLSITTEVLSAA